MLARPNPAHYNSSQDSVNISLKLHQGIVSIQAIPVIRWLREPIYNWALLQHIIPTQSITNTKAER